jgi:hypothetical protein
MSYLLWFEQAIVAFMRRYLYLVQGYACSLKTLLRVKTHDLTVESYVQGVSFLKASLLEQLSCLMLFFEDILLITLSLFFL